MQKLLKTSRKKTIFAEDISEDLSDLTFTGFYISGYLRNLRGRLLSSEKFSEVLPFGFLPLSRFQFTQKIFFELRNLHKKCSEIFPEI